MNYQIAILPEVLDDLEESVLWYELQLNGLGFEFENEFYNCLSVVQENPMSFQIRYLTIRIGWINRFPFGIHYLVEGNSIVVTGLFHTSRDPEIWDKRLK